MARYVTSVRTDRPAAEVFAYLADLRHFADWDPGVPRAVQVVGDGPGMGAVFEVDVATIGPAMTLRYETVAFDQPREVVVKAHNLWFTSLDRITVVPDAGGTLVTYDAELRLNGPLALGDLALRLVFRPIGDRAAAGLRRALDGVLAP